MHHTDIRHLLMLIIVLCAVSLRPDASAITVSPLPSLEYASQAWVGFSADDRYAVRISLKADGTGSGTLLSGNLVAEPFEITSWKLESRALIFSVDFHSRERSAAHLAGRFKEHLLSYNNRMLPDPERLSANNLPGPLELTFEDGDYRARFGVWPEDDLNKRVHLLKDASDS